MLYINGSCRPNIPQSLLHPKFRTGGIPRAKSAAACNSDKRKLRVGSIGVRQKVFNIRTS